MEDSQGLKVIRSLVIEDNPTNLELMTYILSAFGHTTITAVDGEAGVQAALECSPSIVLCDVHLPKLDGYEVAVRLKSHPVLRHVPLIAVTALAMVGDRERLLAAGFDGYIAKPIAPETFTKQVEDYLHVADRLGKRLEEHPPADSSNLLVPQPVRGTIFVINHSESNLELARMILEPSGFEVRAQADARELFSAETPSPPDLIMYDVQGHEDRGVEFLQQITADKRFCDRPVILISSSVWRERDRGRTDEFGPVRHIVRPVDPALLIMIINQCLATEPSR